MDGVVDEQHGVGRGVATSTDIGVCASFGGVYRVACDNIGGALAELVGAEYNGA